MLKQELMDIVTPETAAQIAHGPFEYYEIKELDALKVTGQIKQVLELVKELPHEVYVCCYEDGAGLLAEEEDNHIFVVVEDRFIIDPRILSLEELEEHGEVAEPRYILEAILDADYALIYDLYGDEDSWNKVSDPTVEKPEDLFEGE